MVWGCVNVQRKTSFSTFWKESVDISTSSLTLTKQTGLTFWPHLDTPKCGHPGCEISNKACAFVDFNHWRDKGKCISDKVIYRSKGLLGNWRSARQFYCIQSADFGLLPIWIWIYIYIYFYFSCVFPYMLPHTCTQELIISHWDVSLRAEWLP